MADRIPLTIGPLTKGGIAAQALVAFPKSPTPAPGVVVTFHRGGLDAFTEWMVDDLAARGFAAIAPDHFHVLPPGKSPDDRKDYMSDEQIAADMAAAALWLRDQESVRGETLAAMGPCMGGRQVLIALECNPELWGCGCAWYGGGAFQPAIGALPAPASRERLALIACPLEGYFGNLDLNPSPADVDRLDGLLTELGKEHVFHRYDGCHHGFLNRFTGRPGHYDDPAAKDSWARSMRFMAAHLGAPAPVAA